MFHNPHMPTMDDYYEPWTYEYDTLFTAPAGDDQPIARTVSLVTGRPMTPEAGPNWDDDLGGSGVYAANDPNLAALDEHERRELFALERLFFFHLPRTCNHCLNPACVAACPSAAIYKRGEDGVVLIDQARCRGWRSCVAACPYKKTYFNWAAGKSEKCILCFPRIESGEPPACFQGCPGRIRFLGILLYDAERIRDAAAADARRLVAEQLELILDPFDPLVVEAAERNGVAPSTLAAARRSPVYRFVKEWRIALPLHPEFRTVPMLFYVPPLTPGGRAPVRYLASLFGGGDEDRVRYAIEKQHAVRAHRRAAALDGDGPDRVAADELLAHADSTRAQADEIYHLTALATSAERFVVPPAFREEAERTPGFGFLEPEGGGQ
jgi:nitrate reductase beta subunit